MILNKVSEYVWGPMFLSIKMSFFWKLWLVCYYQDLLKQKIFREFFARHGAYCPNKLSCFNAEIRAADT